jgi:CheY-like chemotaxis protein
MPEMDGLELIRVLRGNYPGLRIVALSAHEEELYVSEALKHGADTYVLKGVPLKDLVGTIRRVMWGRIDLPSEVTEPLISSFRLADSVLGMLGQAFAAFYRGEEALDFLASCAAELCGGELYALAFRNGDAFGMETGKLRKERRPPICEAEGWSLSERDLFELVALVDGRHPVVCNEHRLRNRARGWRSPYIHLVINPVFLGDGLEALMLIAGSRPFHLSPPLVRYLGLLSDQAAVFLDLLGLRREKSRLEEANGRLRDLLRYVAGEAAGGANLRRMLEILVESLGLRSGTLFGRSEGGRWRVVCKYGLSEEEAAALAKVIAGSTAYVDPPRPRCLPAGPGDGNGRKRKTTAPLSWSFPSTRMPRRGRARGKRVSCTWMGGAPGRGRPSPPSSWPWSSRRISPPRRRRTSCKVLRPAWEVSSRG